MPQSARDYQPGQRVPGTVYQIVRLIGAGGMGTVYDVEDTTIGKRYVLKTLHPRLGTREDLARRMRSEARTLARLHHPNIVDVITAGVTSDSLHLPFYVMERLTGQSLRVVLDKKFRLELSHALHIGIDLLDALDHAHDKGVIHRDVKPDNIFLHRTVAGVTVTKLLDFGIMSLLDAAPNEPAGRFMGTLRYAAPEQLRGEKPSPRVDVYATGLVIYEMLSGRGPFDDEGEPERIAAAHLHKEPPPLSRFAEVPEELDAAIMGSLSKSPWVRPRDAFSFATTLRNLKRVYAGGSFSESRPTAAGEGEAIPKESLVRVAQPSPDGQYVILPLNAGAATDGVRRESEIASSSDEGITGTFVSALNAEMDSEESSGRTATLTPILRADPQHGTDVIDHGDELTVDPDRQSDELGPPLVPPPSYSMTTHTEDSASEESITPQMRSFRAVVRERGKRTVPVVFMGIGLVAASAILIVRSVGKPADEPASTLSTSTVPFDDAFALVPGPTIPPPAFDDPPSRPQHSTMTTMHAAPTSTRSGAPSSRDDSPAPSTEASDRSGSGLKKDAGTRAASSRQPPTEKPGPGF